MMEDVKNATAQATPTAESASETLYGIKASHDKPADEAPAKDSQDSSTDKPAADAPKDDKKPDEKPAVEDKKDESKKDGESKEKKDEPAKLELKLPEKSPLKPEVVEQVQAYAKEHGLNEKQAQAILNAKHDAVVDAANELFAEAETKKQNWATEIENDSELGGANFADTAKITQAVISKFGSEKLKEDLNRSGLGNHPELVRMLRKIGDTMKIGNDKAVHGSAGGGDLSPEKTLYPNQR